MQSLGVAFLLTLTTLTFTRAKEHTAVDLTSSNFDERLASLPKGTKVVSLERTAAPSGGIPSLLRSLCIRLLCCATGPCGVLRKLVPSRRFAPTASYDKVA